MHVKTRDFYCAHKSEVAGTSLFKDAYTKQNIIATIIATLSSSE